MWRVSGRVVDFTSLLKLIKRLRFFIPDDPAYRLFDEAERYLYNKVDGRLVVFKRLSIIWSDGDRNGGRVALCIHNSLKARVIASEHYWSEPFANPRLLIVYRTAKKMFTNICCGSVQTSMHFLSWKHGWGKQLTPPVCDFSQNICCFIQLCTICRYLITWILTLTTDWQADT